MRITKTLAMACLACSLASYTFGGDPDAKPINTQVTLLSSCNAWGNTQAASKDIMKRITDATPGTAGQLSLVAIPADKVRYRENYQGTHLLLVNRTDADETFSSCDSMISIVQEAQDKAGKWCAIEACPSSWCGNSYYDVTLSKGSYWDFTEPRYIGTQKTKMRFVLQTPVPIYSNEFDGAVNPEQFVKTAANDSKRRKMLEALNELDEKVPSAQSAPDPK